MSDIHTGEDASAGEDRGLNHVEPAYGGSAESAGDSIYEMDPAVSSTGGKDDMFVDCPDEIENSDSQQSSEEKNNVQTDLDNEEADSGINVQELMAEIELLRDKLEKSAENQRLAQEHEVAKIRELQSVLSMKDQDIDFLNAKIAELSESSNIAQSNYQLYEVQLEKDQHIEESTNRTLASLFTVHNHEELLDGSLEEKISNVEKSVNFIVEKYNHFISDSDQLKGCLNEVGLDLNTIDENGAFVTARDKIHELRRKEENLCQTLSNLEDENRKLVEQVEKQRSTAENVNAEIGRLSAEVEHEKNRYANTKEKLSMAVTKGKALVQQRDSLKQMLAEKTSELENCSVELQEKSIALEAAEKTKELVVASEKFAASLQESLVEKDVILQKCEDILSETVATNELQPTDIPDKLRWLADENKSLKAISLQYRKLADALMSFDFPETVASSELDVRVRWLADSFYIYKEEAVKFQSEIDKTKEVAQGEIDHLATSLSAEIQDKSYLQAEIDDLRNKYDAHERLQRELAEDREAVNIEIDQLRKSLLAESQEKSNLQSELENLRHEYEGVVQKEYLVSLEKDKIVNMLMEASGLANGGHEDVRTEHSDLNSIVDNCFSRIKENTRRNELPKVDAEIVECFKSHLFIRDQEMSLYKLIVEEDILDRAQVSRLSDELETKTQNLNALKDENADMQKSRGQLEDRCALLKDKLSMAVKKGKGLVQERENLKSSLDEKNTEIDRLKSELQENLSRYSECQVEITKLSLDVDRISLLETDLFAAKECKDQLEQFLAESNSMLQRVIESIEGITTPTDLSFEEPVEKVKWVAQYLSEMESLKMEMEQELRTVKDEAISLATQLSEIQTSMQTMESALLVAENNRFKLLDEKKELEVSKTLLEEELQKKKEEASSHTSKFEELHVSKRALEDALSLAEDNISRFVNERDVAIESRDLSEEQLQKLKEEFSNQITKLDDADKTIQSLEDALSEAQKNITLLTEENSKIQVASSHASKIEELNVSKRALEDALSLAEDNISRFVNERDVAIESRDLSEEQLQKLKEEFSNQITKLDDADKTIQSLEDALSEAQKNITLLAEENSKIQVCTANFDSEMKKIREEALSYASKLSEASLTIKSLEDALLNAENNTLELVREKKTAEEEIIALTAKLESHKEELAGTRGSLENRSLELSGQLSRLNLLLEDETLTSLIGQCFDRKSESLNSLGFLLEEIADCFREMDSDLPQNIPVVEDDSLPTNHDTAFNMELSNDKVNAVDSESLVFQIEKMNERFHLKSKTLADKFDNLSNNMDKSIAVLLRRLHLTKDNMTSIIKCVQSLKQQLMDTRTDKQKQEETVVSLELENQTLLSACNNAIQSLELNVCKSVAEIRSIHDVSKLDDSILMEFGAVGNEKAEELATDHVKTAEKLSLATRQNENLNKLFQDATNKLLSINEDTQNKLEKTQLTCEEALEERDLYKEKISKMEANLKELQNSCDEMKIKLDEYVEKEDEWRKNEVELSTSLSKLHELEDSLLSASQVKSIVNKVDEVEIPDDAFPVGDSHDSASVRKLFYVLDSYNGFLKKVSSLSSENEELQSAIDQQILEIELLKRQVDDNHVDNDKDSEKRDVSLELELGLQSIVRNLGGTDMIDDFTVDGSTSLLPLLRKLVMGKMHESESLKSKNEELGAKLLGTQKAVDDLLNKVKILEDSNQARIVPSEIQQERGISIDSLPSQSEISEIQDLAAHGKNNTLTPVQSAAHVRLLRKGSNDHLAINIDSESERLDNKESDDDKGHIFKSLNNSGLIPRQGRTAADRVDGIWVSGSRALMSHPRGRLGVIAYWLVLHIWLFGTIL